MFCYNVGLELGIVWEDKTVPLRLAGNLADFEARAVFVKGEIDGFSSIQFAFA
jgi:hypothetical protein